MTFQIKTGKQFNNEGAVYTAPIVARKINGFKVIDDEGEITFICNEDIKVLSMSEAEKNMPLEL